LVSPLQIMYRMRRHGLYIFASIPPPHFLAFPPSYRNRRSSTLPKITAIYELLSTAIRLLPTVGAERSQRWAWCRRKSTFTTTTPADWCTTSHRGRVWTEQFGRATKIYDGDAASYGQSAGRSSDEQSGRCRLLCVADRMLPRKGAFMSAPGARPYSRCALYCCGYSRYDVMIVARNVGRRKLRSAEMIITQSQSRLPRT